MAEWIEEMHWTCKSCGSKRILGRHKDCPHCGSPREEGEMDMSEAEREADAVPPPRVTDPALLDLANAGADQFCRNCEAGNRGDALSCVKCGAPLKEPTVPPVSRPTPSRSYSPTPPPTSPPPPPKRPNPGPIFDEVPEPPASNTWFYWLLGGLAGVCGLFFLIWAFQTEVVEARVSQMHWLREIYTDTFAPVIVRKFPQDTVAVPHRDPVLGHGESAGMEEAGNCRMAHHHYDHRECSQLSQAGDCCTMGEIAECDNQYRSETESYACTRTETYREVSGKTCTNPHNGFRKCSDTYSTHTRSVPDTCTRTKKIFVRRVCDCKNSIQAMECDYKTWKWVEVRRTPKEGDGLEPTWPDVAPGPVDRLRREETYTVTFSYLDDGEAKTHQVVTHDQGAYQSWADQEIYYLNLYNIGGVEGIYRTREEIQ